MNKTKEKKETTIAAAIGYDSQKDAAPRVTAKGRGIIGERILDLAVKHGVPVRKDPALVQILSRLDIDEQIPPELYKAVAEILAFIYSINERYREKQSIS
jgi:flagellar biosynthesis protein